MSFGVTLVLGVFVFGIGCAMLARFLVRFKAEKTIELLSTVFTLSFFLYVGLGGYYGGEEGFWGFVGGAVLHALTGVFMLAHQPMEAILLLLHINEPTRWPNLFIEGPSAHFSR